MGLMGRLVRRRPGRPDLARLGLGQQTKGRQPRHGQRSVNERGVRSNGSRQRRRPPLLDRK